MTFLHFHGAYANELLLAGFAFACTVAWIVHSRKSRLTAIDKLPERLRPNLISPELQTYFDAVAQYDDTTFFALSGGTAGLRARRANARAIIHALQHCAELGFLPETELAEPIRRAHRLYLLTILSFVERWLFGGGYRCPRYFARAATETYASVVARTKLLANVYNLRPLQQIHAVL